MESYESALKETRYRVETVVSDAVVPWTDFFNSVAFFKFHKKEAKGFYFQLIDKETKKSLCAAHFTEKEPGLFASPFRGTYGGIDTKEHDVTLLDVFLEDISAKLKKEGAERMQLALAPFAHDQDRSALLFNVLLRHGFAIVKQDINYDLTVDAVPLIDKMERNNQKRVRKCEREHCIFEHCDSEKEYAAVYDVIKKNRESKGYPVTMSLEDMLEMKKLFPDVWQFFCTKLEGKMIAASVCIRINTNVLYVFYWGDLPEMHAYSPVAFHADNLYRYCQKEKIGILDIGTSTDNCIPNLGLMNFKERLGCKTSLKLVLAKNL